MDYDPTNPRTRPDATVVIRGGERNVEHLANVMTQDGSWSVISEPGISFEVLSAGIRNGKVRRTTLKRVLAAGGTLVPTRNDGPPYHCDLSGLTAAVFDAILGPEEDNPVPKASRWRGNDR